MFDPCSLLLLLLVKESHALEANLNFIESTVALSLSRYERSIVILLAKNNNVIEISPVCYLKCEVLLFIFKVVPEQPQNLSCIQKGEHGTVACTWDRGRDTHLYTAYTLQ